MKSTRGDGERLISCVRRKGAGTPKPMDKQGATLREAGVANARAPKANTARSPNRQPPRNEKRPAAKPGYLNSLK